MSVYVWSEKLSNKVHNDVCYEAEPAQHSQLHRRDFRAAEAFESWEKREKCKQKIRTEKTTLARPTQLRNE